jgi:WD40 repeat protein
MMLVERARQEKQDGRVVQLLRTFIPDDPEEEDPRDFEWYHLWREYHGEKSRLWGHKGAVTAVAFSPDDRLIASGSADNTVKRWDAGTGKEVRSLNGHQARVTCVAFSPDGTHLATASADRTVRLWDSATGQQLHCFKDHERVVNCVAYSPDGRQIISGAEDRTVRVWDVATGQATETFRGHTSPIKAVAFAPDAKKLASIGQEPKKGEFLVWEVSGGNIVFKKNGNPWTSVAFSPDGQHLATGELGILAEDGKSAFRVPVAKPAVRVWDMRGAPVQRLQGHADAITQVAYSPGAIRWHRRAWTRPCGSGTSPPARRSWRFTRNRPPLAWRLARTARGSCREVRTKP